MTVFVVPLAPLDAEAVGNLAASSLLSSSEAIELYRSMAADTIAAATDSGGDVIVTYPSSDRAATGDPAETARSIVTDGPAALEEVRFEVQVGSNPSARVGNAITHLLREEAADSAAFLDPATPTATRRHLDAAAMQLRRHEMVLGPSHEGRIYCAGFTEPIDFSESLRPPALVQLADAGARASHSIGFLEALPTVDRGPDLRSLVALLRARELAGRAVPARTTETVTDLGLMITDAADDDEDFTLDRRSGPDSS